MATVDTSWYDLIAKGITPQNMVRNDGFFNAISLKEMENVEITCAIPITKMAYKIFDGNDATVLENVIPFPEGGVTRIVFKDVIPLEELKPYETEDCRYGMDVTVTLISGDEVSGRKAFKGYLHAGETTTKLPGGNLLEQLAAIPVARPGMTEDELRQICVDYIKLETEFPFKLEEDFTYEIYSQKLPRKLLAGKVYGGIPYVTRGAGNLYRIAEVYDPETGTLSRDSDIFDNIRCFGNACSGAASMAWARVVTSAYLGYTMFMCEANGFLPVGPYRYPQENLMRFRPDGCSCKTVCKYNGEQTMFESYAKMKPADGLVCPGHVRMNAAVPTVVRNADGTINPEESYSLIHEQVCYTAHPNHIRIAPDGTHYVAQGCVDIKYTFRELFDTNYLPVTFAEFQDPSKVEPARIRLAVEPELKDRVLTANYPISDVFVETNGKRYTYRNVEFFRKEVKMGDIFPKEALTQDAKITCQLYNGERLEVAQ